jgi:hypothetical protein
VLDPIFLEDFKQTINDHDSYLINRYSDFNGVNKWNLICSAKDWLHVSVYGISFINLNHENDDARSLNVLQYIMALDLIVQAIKQLFRVILNKDSYPLERDKTVFNRVVTDDDHFIQIRACFAAHPVNLNSTDGTKGNKEKFFASWSSNSSGEDAYIVYLYSNKPGEQPHPFSINLHEIYVYAKMRYELLNELIALIEKEKELFVERYKIKTIQKVQEPIEQLRILYTENIERIAEGDGYEFEILTLLSLYNAPQNFHGEDSSLYNDFLASLGDLINDIFENLQTMKFENLSHAHLLHPKRKNYKEISYDITKIFEYIFNPTYSSSLLEHHISQLVKKGLLPSYANSQTNKQDLHLMILTRMNKTW